MTTENLNTPENVTPPANPSAEEAGLKIAAKPAAGSPEAVAAEAAAVEAAAKAAAEAAAKAKAEEVVVVEYDATGDSALDLALEFVGNLGIGPEHAAMVAAQAGDFGPLTEHLKGMGAKAKGYERYMKAGVDAFKRGAADTKAKADQTAADEAQTKAKIYAAMGGEENWPAIQAWAATAATDKEKEEVKAAFKAGGQTAIAMAERLTNLYRKQGGSFQGKSAVKADAKGGTPPADVNSKLDPQAYARAAAIARKAYRGPNWDTSEEYKALRARLK